MEATLHRRVLAAKPAAPPWPDRDAARDFAIRETAKAMCTAQHESEMPCDECARRAETLVLARGNESPPGRAFRAAFSADRTLAEDCRKILFVVGQLSSKPNRQRLRRIKSAIEHFKHRTFPPRLVHDERFEDRRTAGAAVLMLVQALEQLWPLQNGLVKDLRAQVATGTRRKNAAQIAFVDELVAAAGQHERVLRGRVVYATACWLGVAELPASKAVQEEQSELWQKRIDRARSRLSRKTTSRI